MSKDNPVSADMERKTGTRPTAPDASDAPSLKAQVMFGLKLAAVAGIFFLLIWFCER
ncbi:MAG: hypothetical protein AB7D47_07540 [Desulfovibrio sp.]|jgi:hypothetical protein